MSEIKKSNDVIELDVLHNIFLANANKMEKDLPVDIGWTYMQLGT